MAQKKTKLKTFIVECCETEARSTTYRVTATDAVAAQQLIRSGALRTADGGKNFTRIEDDYEDMLTCDVVGVREEK